MVGISALCPLSLLTLKDSSLGMETIRDTKSLEPASGLQGSVNTLILGTGMWHKQVRSRGGGSGVAMGFVRFRKG